MLFLSCTSLYVAFNKLLPFVKGPASVFSPMVLYIDRKK